MLYHMFIIKSYYFTNHLCNLPDCMPDQAVWYNPFLYAVQMGVVLRDLCIPIIYIFCVCML